jgi:ABC-type transport system involved in multi-copper enzyme maturation permease subunit
MSTAPHTTRETALPSPIRRDTVVMGRADYMSVVLRLIGVELYKIRRRSMSKILSIIAIFVMLIAFFAIALTPIIIARNNVSAFLPPPCTPTSRPSIESCLDHAPTAADLQRAEQAKEETVRQTSTSLRLPDSLYTANAIAQSIGLLLIAILAGTIVGGEYSVSTIRLMFTRGPTRTQFILSKVGAILVCIFIGLYALLLIGVEFGAIFNLFTGVDAHFTFLTSSSILHLVLYLLVSMLGLFAYAMIALCLAALGRTTAAGVAGALVWWVLESVLSQLLNAVGAQVGGVLGEILKAIPTCFIGNNINTLSQNQIGYVLGGPLSQASDIHALLVLLLYLVFSIALACWITKKRDITN